jgi:methionyl-tRNA formyltransferase
MRRKPGVVLCTCSGVYAANVLKTLLVSDELDVVGIVNSTRILSKKESPFRSALWLVQQCGLVYALNLSLVTTGYNLLSYITRSDTVHSLARKHEIPLYNTSDINDEQGRDFLRKIQPDYLLTAFFNQIIKSDILDWLPDRCLNIHPSLLPDYKGVDPVFYMLLNKEQEIGVTLHYVDQGIDTGDIISQRTVAVKPGDDLCSIYTKLFTQGAELYVDTVGGQNEANHSRMQQGREGRYDSWPTRKMVGRFKHQGGSLLSRGSFYRVFMGRV